MVKKKAPNRTKNLHSKPKKSKKEEAATVKKSSKDIPEKSEPIKAKKTANSIKKNKDTVNAKTVSGPPASTMPNIMTMLS